MDLADTENFGTKGVGGSSISFNNCEVAGHVGLHKGFTLHQAVCGLAVNSRQTQAAAKLTASARSSQHVRL